MVRQLGLRPLEDFVPPCGFRRSPDVAACRDSTVMYVETTLCSIADPTRYLIRGIDPMCDEDLGVGQLQRSGSHSTLPSGLLYMYTYSCTAVQLYVMLNAVARL